MRTMTIEKFKNLVARSDWHHEQNLELEWEHTLEIEEWDEEKQSLKTFDITKVYGTATKTSNLEGIEITFIEGFSFHKGDPDSFKKSDLSDPEIPCYSYIDGVVVVEDGEELVEGELMDCLPSEFSDINYADFSIIQEVTDIDIDIDEDSDMETFTLKIDNAPNLRFTGELLASAASSENRALRNYSGESGRWTELELYKTKGGKFICYKIGRTCLQGERDRFSGEVCETLAAVKEYFGHRWLAKRIYTEAGIDDAVDVD